MSKLAIAAETEEDRYDTMTRVMCYACCEEDVDKSSGRLPAVIEGVMKALTFSKREEIKAWEQEFVPCEHTLCLVQQESKQIESKGNLHLASFSLLLASLTLRHRSNSVFDVRSQGKSLALFGMWQSRLRTQSVRWCWRKLPRLGSCELQFSQCGCQTRLHYS